MKLLEKTTTIRHRSNKQPQALILNIPAQIRDIMKLTHGTEVTLTVCVENEKAYLRVEKQD
jgi:hypothetical protein